AREELGVETETRSMARSELYTADECFLCGTGAEITPVTMIDHRAIGSGEVGELTERLRQMFFEVVRGRRPKYAGWLYPVEAKERVPVGA
ncbi:MAG TPA: branched chain amino acid aminotransferase, partial [Chloroflexota bacterium]|nr:branched chain amino acid aminotransferase [Chloroflexota bacterium]